jgi:hypothetical protein
MSCKLVLTPLLELSSAVILLNLVSRLSPKFKPNYIDQRFSIWVIQ